jgi:hypothetical protein
MNEECCVCCIGLERAVKGSDNGSGYILHTDSMMLFIFKYTNKTQLKPQSTIFKPKFEMHALQYSLYTINEPNLSLRRILNAYGSLLTLKSDNEAIKSSNSFVAEDAPAL